MLAAIAVAGVLVTRAIAADDERHRRMQAAVWFETAQAELTAGRIEAGVRALRRAAMKDPGNGSYGLALARALADEGRSGEARRLLLELRDRRPEDPETNLQLARLEARAGDGDAARRYYENAVAALWRPEQSPRRREIRLELIDMLLARGERARALSQLLVLVADAPDQADLRVQVGRRFLDAGDPGHALDHFVAALRTQPQRRDALAGAGESAFELGDYARARRYLGAVAGDARLADLLEVARLVVTGDPLAPRIGAAERRRRLSAAMAQATSRLDACLGARQDEPRAELESLDAEALSLTAALRRRTVVRDVIEDGLHLAYRIERAVERRCAVPAAPLDRALQLIGRRYGFDEA